MKFALSIITLLTSSLFAEPAVEQVLTSQIIQLKNVEDLPLALGDLVVTYRHVDTTAMTAETSQAKIISFENGDALAMIVQDETPESKALFKKFPGVMAGDKVRLPQLRIAPTQQALPELVFTFRDLFDDPKASPISFDLSEKGLQNLDERLAHYLSANVPRIFVEAYVDEFQPKAVSLLETQLRAQAVRQVLIDTFKIDPNRVVALGFGEMEPTLDRLTPDSTLQNRRVVIRFEQE